MGRVACALRGHTTPRVSAVEILTTDLGLLYEALLEILSEIYVTSGAVEQADYDEDVILFNHEPGLSKGRKQPEFEVCLAGQWCAIEVKTPRLISYRTSCTQRTVQLNSRLFTEKIREESTKPRDNPVKDFLVSADAKFESYEDYRTGSIRILVIVWDDFCNEPITALNSVASGLLTSRSFFRTSDNKPVTYPHIDAIIIIRHQHQLRLATKCEPLADGVRDAFNYHHNGFPPKVLIPCHGGREIPQEVMVALNAIPLSKQLGAEYHSQDVVFWMPLDLSQS